MVFSFPRLCQKMCPEVIRLQQKYESTMQITFFNEMRCVPREKIINILLRSCHQNFCVEDIEKENLIRKERKS